MERYSGWIAVTWPWFSTTSDGPGLSDESRRRKDAFLDQHLAKLNAKRIIDPENRDGDAANRRATDEVSVLPVKVPRPFMTAWVKQPSVFLSWNLDR